MAAETPNPIMNPHSRPNMIQPTKISVHTGLFEGCTLNRIVNAVTTRKAHAAQIQKVNRSIKMVNTQNQMLNGEELF